MGEPASDVGLAVPRQEAPVNSTRPAIASRLLAVLLLVGTSACSPADRGPSADLLLTGITVLTGTETIADGAVAVRSGRILAVGPAARLESRRGEDTRVVELDGTVAAPAFVDHHVHLMNIGLTLLNAARDGSLHTDLSGLDQEQVAAAVAARSGVGEADWRLGKGWSQGAWGATDLPDREVLDAALPDAPVFLSRVDGHAGWVNGAALALAGIDAATPDPAGGVIVRRPDGTPTGVLLERANEAVAALVPTPAAAELEEAFRLAAAALAAQGVVEVYDAGFLSHPGVVNLADDLDSYLAALLAADRAAPLPLRINLMIPAPTVLADAVLADPGSYRELSPRVRVTHIKLFADGAMGSRGAFLSHPFADDPHNRGVARMSAEEIRAWSERALDAGLGVATHAIGDAAVARALDAYEAILAERPDLDAGRLRIEHFSYAAMADMQRAAALGVVLSIQPNFVLPDDDGVAMEDDRVGADNVRRVYAWGTLEDLGARLALGSDYFTFPFEPLYTLHAAATRANAAGLPQEGWHADERLARDRALALTSTLIRPGGEAHSHRLAAGEPADLVLLSADPLTAGSVLDIEILATLSAGRPTHSAAGLDLRPAASLENR